MKEIEIKSIEKKQKKETKTTIERKKYPPSLFTTPITVKC